MEAGGVKRTDIGTDGHTYNLPLAMYINEANMETAQLASWAKGLVNRIWADNLILAMEVAKYSFYLDRVS